MKQIPKITRWLLFISAAVWLLLSIGTLIRMPRQETVPPIVTGAVLILMAGNVLALIISGVGLGTGKKLYYLITLAVMAVNIILTFTDEFGLLDFVTLVIDLAVVGLLIFDRKRYLVPHDTLPPLP